MYSSRRDEEEKEKRDIEAINKKEIDLSGCLTSDLLPFLGMLRCVAATLAVLACCNL